VTMLGPLMCLSIVGPALTRNAGVAAGSRNRHAVPEFSQNHTPTTAVLHPLDPSSSESSADRAANGPQQGCRARTASEVLLLDALDVAARRGWADYVQMMILERARQHLAVLKAWSSSTVAVPPKESSMATPRSDNPDNSAGSRWPLNHRLRGAILVAEKVSNRTKSQTQTLHQGDLIMMATRVLDSHARSLRRLPDSLREVIDRELCVMHRRFVVSGAPQAENAELAARPNSAIDDTDDDERGPRQHNPSSRQHDPSIQYARFTARCCLSSLAPGGRRNTVVAKED